MVPEIRRKQDPADRAGPARRIDDKHRYLGMKDQRLGKTSEQEPLQAVPRMGSQDDQVRVPRSGVGQKGPDRLPQQGRALDQDFGAREASEMDFLKRFFQGLLARRLQLPDMGLA